MYTFALKEESMTPTSLVWTVHSDFLVKRTVWKGDKRNNTLLRWSWTISSVINHVYRMHFKYDMITMALYFLPPQNSKTQSIQETFKNEANSSRRISYKITDQYSSKLSRYLKIRKFWETVTTKTMVPKRTWQLNVI